MTSNTLINNTKQNGYPYLMPRTTDLFCSSGSRELRGTPYDFANDNFEHVITPSEDGRDYHYDYRDPVVEEKSEDDAEEQTVLRPNPAGFGPLFGLPHSNLKTYGSRPEQNVSYMNYVTRQDINLIFYLASIGTVLPRLGYGFPHSAAFSEEHGGYPWGAIVYGADGNAYISIRDDNEEVPSSAATQWIPYRSYEWFNYAKVYNNSCNDSWTETDASWSNNDASGHAISVALKGGTLLNGGYRPIIVWRMFTVEEYGDEYTYWVDSEGNRYDSPEGTVTSLTLPSSSAISALKSSSNIKSDNGGEEKVDSFVRPLSAGYDDVMANVVVESNLPKVGDTINLAESGALTEVTGHRRATSPDQYHTWIQAYKYWVKCGSNAEDLDQTPEEIFFKVPQNDNENDCQIKSASDESVYLKYVGGEDDEVYEKGLNAGTNPTYIKLSGGKNIEATAGSTLNGTRKTSGFYVIDWRGDTDTSDETIDEVEPDERKEDGTVNPFGLLELDAYWNRQGGQATEYAFDVSRYGYECGDFAAAPEYDEPVSDVVGEFEVGYNEGQLRPGLVYLYDRTGSVIDNLSNEPTAVGWTPTSMPANLSSFQTPVEKLASTPANLNGFNASTSLALETELAETSSMDIADPFTSDKTFTSASSTTNTHADEHYKLTMQSGVYERGVYFVLEALQSEETTADSATSKKWVEIAVLQRRTALYFPQTKTWDRVSDLMPDFTTSGTYCLPDSLDNGIAGYLTETPQGTDYALCGPGKYRIRVRCKNTVFGEFREGWGRYAKNDDEVRDTLVLCSIPYDHVTNAISYATYDSDIRGRLAGNFWAAEHLTSDDVRNGGDSV